MINVFIPSYHRPTNNKTAKLMHNYGWDMSKVVVFIDSEADDRAEYEKECERLGCKLVVFDMDEARARYDYVHRPSESRRSAGQARNTFADYALNNGIRYYMVMDDDSNNFQVKSHGTNYIGLAKGNLVKMAFDWMVEFMIKHHIGLFGYSQTGDTYGWSDRLFRRKVMNTTFYDATMVQRGERGVQDDDTSMFVGIMNEGLFTGSFADGLILQQTPSAKAKGGLTDLYNECKLYNKAMIVPIQFPSCSRAERQKKNGGRLHHRINYRYLMPCLLKMGKDARSNIAWDTYPEDIPFTNEPKRNTNEFNE